MPKALSKIVDAWKVRLQYKDGQLNMVIFKHYMDNRVTKEVQTGSYKEGEIWDINLGSVVSQKRIEKWIKKPNEKAE